MAKRDLPAPANLEERARLELLFDQPYLLGPLFGDYDRHLVMIEDRLGVNIAARGNRVMIDGEPDAAARAHAVVAVLFGMALTHDVLATAADDDDATVRHLGGALQRLLDGA